MFDMNLFFLLIAVFFGVVTSYTDIRYGKVRNKHVLLFVMLGVLSYLLFIVFNVSKINYPFILQTLTNFLFALVLGYIMWIFAMWTPGDGKLFTVYALLIPLSVYSLGHIKILNVLNFSSLNILVNTFIPIFIFMFVNILVKSSIVKKKEALKRTFDLRVVIGVVLSLFVYSWVVDVIFGFLRLSPNMFFTYIIVLMVFLLTEKVFLVTHYKVFLVLSVARLIIDNSWRNFAFLQSFFMMVMVFIVFRYLIIELGFSTFTKEIAIGDLKEGMVLADMFYEKEKKVEKRRAIYFSITSYLKDMSVERLIDHKTEGVVKKDIQNLLKLSKKHSNLKVVRIVETLPFAPFMLMGVIFTFLFKGNMIFYIIQLL